MKKNLIPLAIAACALLASCSQQQEEKVNPLLEHENEITEIINQMTLEEKVEMLHGKTMFSSAGVERLGIADVKYADGPFGIREELQPHSWMPLGLTTDSATFFPTGSALAATWSPELAYEYGTAMAKEARLRGLDMILGPAINIQRIPTGGRTYEYLSEDPMLSAELAVGYTNGVQDNGAAVCIKHFAMNNQEDMRGFVNVNISERAMREIYLPPFEAAVKHANAMGVMAAYNKVAGRWCSENDTLQNKILRDEWGFKGMIISDWGGTHSTVGAVTGGLDVEMPGHDYMGEALLDSVKSGAVSMDVIDTRVRDILRVRYAITPIPSDSANRVMTSQPETQAVAYIVAAHSITLLKNEGLLPINLEKAQTIAVIGDNAVRTMAQGGVGAGVKALYEITPLQGLEKAVEGTNTKLVYAQGYAPFIRTWGGPEPDEKAEAAKNAKLREEALAVAKDADLVLFIGGDNRWVETEGSDRKDIKLQCDQDGLLQALAEVNPNIVSVMVAGAPVDLNVVNAVSKGLVYTYFNGTEGGHALADVLTGKISPSGKLPYTLPVKLEDSPAYALGNYPQKVEGPAEDVFVDLVKRADFMAHRKADAYYTEGLFVGYRWFTSKGIQTMYPFGYGLSYANFEYSNLKAEAKKGTIKVTFSLANTSNIPAEEVTEVYVGRPDSKIERPKYELKGFQRVSTGANSKNEVTIEVPVESLRNWNEQTHQWEVEPGKAVIYVGSSSENLPLTAEVNI